MLTDSIGHFAQQTFHRPATSSPSPTKGFLVGRGLLAVGQGKPYEPTITPERSRGVGRSFQALFAHDIFMLDPLIAEEVEVALAQPTAEALAHELRQPSSTLAEKPTAVPTRREPPKPEPDVQPFVMAVRGLIEGERLAAARQMLNAAPAYILSDPLVARLRFVLAPPVVRRVQKRDVDRSGDYEWLRTHEREYRGRWVALVGGDVVASAGTLHDLQEQLRVMALPSPPLLHRVD